MPHGGGAGLTLLVVVLMGALLLVAARGLWCVLHRQRRSAPFLPMDDPSSPDTLLDDYGAGGEVTAVV